MRTLNKHLEDIVLNYQQILRTKTEEIYNKEHQTTRKFRREVLDEKIMYFIVHRRRCVKLAVAVGLSNRRRRRESHNYL